MAALGYTEESVRVANVNIHLRRGGNGPPLLLLQNGIDYGWLSYHQSLADSFTVYAPSHPGFGLTPRLQWVNRMSDLALFYLWFLEELGLKHVHLVGHALGGWLAADLATTCPQMVDRLVLVDAMGLKPRHREILDIFLLTPPEIRAASFYKPDQVPEWERLYGHDPTPEEADRAEDAQEMLMRLGWKPYMHDPRLAAVLPRVKQPSLIIWGREDAIVPLECGELYHQALPNSRLTILDECGHHPQLEKPRAYIDAILAFLSTAKHK